MKNHTKKIAFALFGVVGLLASSAFAGTATTTVTRVEVHRGTGTVYVSFDNLNSSTCSSNKLVVYSEDEGRANVLKIAMAAKLSGSPVIVNYGTKTTSSSCDLEWLVLGD